MSAVSGPIGELSPETPKRVDLSPQGPLEGFEKGVYNHGWKLPYEDNSLDEVRVMDLFQKFDGDQQMLFMNELYRVLKPKSGALIGTPYGGSNKAWQNPTNKRPIFGETYLYYNKGFRDQNGLDIPQIQTDFDISFPFQALDDMLKTRHHEAQQWMAKHLVNSIHDLVALVVKK